MKRPEHDNPTRIRAQEFPPDWLDDSDLRDYEDEDSEPSSPIVIEEIDPDDADYSDNGGARQ